MKNIKLIALCSILSGFFASSNSFAQNNNSGFILLSQNSKQSSFYLKVNSEAYDYTHKIDNYPIFGGVFKIENIDKSIDFYKLYVSRKDCLNGYGSLYRFELDGQYASATSFVFDGGNSGSELAWVLCRMGYPNTDKK